MAPTGRKITHTVLFGLLLIQLSWSQKTSSNEVDSSTALLNYLQQNALKIAPKTTAENFLTNDIILTMEKIPAEVPLMEEQYVDILPEQNSTSQSILNYAEYLGNHQNQFNKKDYIKQNQNIKDTQQMCQHDFNEFESDVFNAIGKIRIVREDGSEEFCVGTLVEDNVVITTATCYKKDAVAIYYQPSWMQDSVRLPVPEYQVPESWTVDGENDFAVFMLENPLKYAPRIDYTLATSKSEDCYITLLGLNPKEEKKDTLNLRTSSSSVNQNSNNSIYKMVTCPNLPHMEQHLNIDQTNCSDQQNCDLNHMDFVTGSPIVLTCTHHHHSEVKHSVIGMLEFKEIKGGSKSTKLDSDPLYAPFLPHMKEYAFPYMFTEDVFDDIKITIQSLL